MLKLRDILGVLRDSYCRTVGIEYMHIQDPEQRAWIQAQVEVALRQARPATSSCASCAGSTPPRRSRRSCRPSTSARSGSASRAASRSSRCSTGSCRRAADDGLDEVVHRHAAPRPAQRAGQHRRQDLRPDLPRVRGQRRTRSRVQGSGDVKYHLGTEGTFTAADGEHDQGLPRRQPLAPRGRRPGARGHRPRQAGPPRPRRRGFTVLPRAACTATRRSPARASSPRR